MKTILKKSILLALLIAFIFPQVVFAGGSTQISISNPSPKVGDSFTVTVSGSSSSQLKISFDARVLELSATTVSGQSGSNSVTVNTKEVTLTFKAKAEGTSGVIVSSNSLSGSSINVSVSGGANASAPAPEATPAPQAPVQEATGEAGAATEPNVSNQVPDGADFLVDGIGMVVSERYPDSAIPGGFSEVRLEINGKTVRELTNGIMTIIYLKPADNIEGEGVFYVYDQNNGTVRRMDLIGSNTDYVILETPENFFSQRLVKTEVNLGERTVDEIYTIEGSNSEFYYIYGADENGANGWYAYDSLTGTVSRADIMSLSLLDSVLTNETEEVTPSEPENKKDSFMLVSKLPFEIPQGVLDVITSKLFIMIVVGVIILIILITIIVNIVRRRNDEYYDDYDYEDDDDEEYYDDDDEDDYKTDIKAENVIDDGPKTSVLEPDDELIDELIKKSSKENQIDIIDLDDL